MKGINNMASNNKEQYKPYTPEEPVSPIERKHEQQEIREAARHAAQEMAAEDLGKDDVKMSKQQAEHEMMDAVKKVKNEK
ncbi:hypothetical protein KDAU_72950 [Dictyobacter aurantiacus]|uniref:Uncharacterized protein n=2 Tax=Dictyobacter aurantiacus TaxID=1936993 RepID=A0A401ZT48_9CHLR|nr:hypothetical protein KDAU_72950 [Dictyobacter aurantiacus]